MSQMSSDSFQSIAEKVNLRADEKHVATMLVLLNPELLTQQYPNSKALASVADELLKKGNSIVAGNRFASAAKLAFYEGDSNSAKAYLEKAVSIDKGSSYDIVLRNFSNFAAFVGEFYKTKAGRVS